jgi:membrane-bound lytic murein transglycosylase A
MKILLIFCFLASSAFAVQEVTPTRRINQSLAISDDLDLENLQLAIERQLRSYARRGGLKGTIRFGTDTYPRSVLQESLETLRLITRNFEACLSEGNRVRCEQELNRELNRHFVIYAPVPGQNEQGRGQLNTTRFTAYYSPDLSGSRVRTERFRRPIYRQPPGELARAYNRVEIDHDRKLAGRGLEIFWVEDSLFDIYLLHVQGGGRITVHNSDGSTETKYLSMTGHNGKRCEFIGHHIARMGWLPRSEALRVPVQRRFLEENPQLEREAFRHCQNYIYFRESDDEPVGRDNIPLTVNRSIALDHTLYRTTGIITFVRATKAVGETATGQIIRRPFERLFLAQDTGSKIRGAARSDLYFGYGPLAELMAYSTNEMGEQYFLVKRP